MSKFFLSWAAGEDDAHVERFFLDLRQRVSELTGEPEPACGFLGAARNGERSWPAGMAEALAGADVFVALRSSRFYVNEVCARQWWVFSERIRRHTPDGDGRSPALITLAWTLGDPAPQPAGTVIAPSYGGTRRSVRQLVRLRGLREEYRTFVADLAGKIVAASDSRPPALAEPVPALADTPSAFTFADLRAHPDAAGSPRVHFAVAAGTRDQMEQVREDVTFYGSTPQEWTPYLPVRSVPLADQARSLAADQLLDSDVGAIEDVVDRIERARRGTEIVVLLVDWWATQMEVYQRILAEIDRRGMAGAAVLVPSSRADVETVQNRDELRFAFGRTFRNSVAGKDPLFRTEIETPDRFDADLAGVIEEARNRIFREGPVHHLLPGEQPMDRPMISGSSQ